MEECGRIWGPYLAALQEDGDLSRLHYTVKNNRVSPYLELQAESLYGNGDYKDGIDHLDVNPYIRFFKIFDPLLSPDDLGYEEFSQSLSDIILHYLADLDLKMGMSKRDFYIRFLVQEMEDGAFGGQKDLCAFSRPEKQSIAAWLLRFYNTGDGPGSLSGSAGELIPLCSVYIREGEEIVFYMRQPFEDAEERRLKFLIRLFLPLACSCTIHWTRTYGVIGYEKTMPVEDFILA